MSFLIKESDIYMGLKPDVFETVEFLFLYKMTFKITFSVGYLLIIADLLGSHLREKQYIPD